MPMQQVQITIPEPCHENWEAMQAAEKGRFCLSCQKQVVDFSAMTDQAVLQYLAAANGNTCGRFAPDQLHRPLHQQTPQRNHFWAKLVFQFLFPAFVFTQKAKAQGFISVVKIQPPVAATLHKKPPQLPYFAIKGRVTDSLTGAAIPYASIAVKGKSQGTQSDIDGNFNLPSLTAFNKTILVVSFIGYKTQEISITNANTSLNIQLNPDVKEMDPVVLLVYPTTGKLKRTFGVVSYTISKDSLRKTVPLTKRIIDTLTGSNHISVYPNPVARGNAMQLNMKKVQKGQYHLQLFSASGSLVQQELITVPAENFNFQWALGSQVAAGNYIVNISSANGKAIFNGKIIITQ
jgi:hypothetical protein